MNRVDSQYQDILTNILEFGDEREDRTGTGTLSYFGGSFRHCFCDGFPVLTTKKMPLKTIATELKWFLKGRTVSNTCGITTVIYGMVTTRRVEGPMENLDQSMENNGEIGMVLTNSRSYYIS